MSDHSSIRESARDDAEVTLRELDARDAIDDEGRRSYCIAFIRYLMDQETISVEDLEP